MAARLVRAASGMRHLRWGREVFATVDAHIAHNDRLTGEQRALLTTEGANGAALLANLDAAVGGYRGWLLTGYLEIRAALRVANFLADEEQRTTDGALRPHRSALAQVLPGGLSRVFSNLPLSRVLRAGHERTARLARDAATRIATVSGTGGLPVLTDLAARLDGVAERIERLLERQDEEIEPQRRPLKLAVERAVLELREGLERTDARLRAQFSPAFIESLYPELSRGSRAVAAEDDVDDDDTENPVDPVVES